jgi:hypothetical protein
VKCDDLLAARLPLAQTELLQRSIGRTLVDIERRLPETLDRYLERGFAHARYFSEASGATQLFFSDGLLHSLCGWPSQLSVIVDDAPAWDDPDAPPVQLSRTTAAPDWLRACLGRTVREVQVHVYLEEGVDSDEARQCAIAYLLEPAEELVYCTYLHGRMDGDELVRGRDLDRSRIARTVAITAGR